MSSPRITILIHTANRSEQLYRLLRYYAASPEIAMFTILIADGSDTENAAVFDRLMRESAIELDYRVLRSSFGIPERLRQALDTVMTPYVMLAADDDFYFLDWVREHVGLFDARDDVTAIIGNYLVFGLGDFTAFSETVSIADGGPERMAIPWLEGETIEARLDELAANPNGMQTMTWYALHRVVALRCVFQHGDRYDLPMLLFERFFTVAQAALGKTLFLEDIFLARQADANPADFYWRKEPMGLRAQREAVARMETCTMTFLTDVAGLDPAYAVTLTRNAFLPEIAMMRQADRRRWLRRIVNRLGIRRWLTVARNVVPPPPRDPRLPQRCDPVELQRRGEQVRLACRPDPAV